jgi:hypothetical protein
MKTMLICLSLTACASPAFSECAHWFSWPCGITPATSVPVFAYAKKKKVPPAHAQAHVVLLAPAPAPSLPRRRSRVPRAVAEVAPQALRQPFERIPLEIPHHECRGIAGQPSLLRLGRRMVDLEHAQAEMAQAQVRMRSLDMSKWRGHLQTAEPLSS